MRQQVALSHWPYSLSAGETLSSAQARALAGGVVVRAGTSAPPACVRIQRRYRWGGERARQPALKLFCSAGEQSGGAVPWCQSGLGRFLVAPSAEVL